MFGTLRERSHNVAGVAHAGNWGAIIPCPGMFCRGTWVTLVSRDIGDSQDATRCWRVPPRGLPEGW